MDAVHAIIQERMRQLLETDEDREKREAGYARASAAFARAIADQVQEYRERIARMEAEPDGAVRNASAIRFHQAWVDENAPAEDEPQPPKGDGAPGRQLGAG